MTNSNPHEHKTLDSFEERNKSSIQEAYQTVKDRLDTLHDTNEIESLALLGDVGVGKTHLLSAIRNGIDEYNKKIRGEGSEYFPRPSEWYNWSDFVAMEKASYDSRDKSPMYRARKTTYLFLDDVGAESNTDHNASIFYRIIDYKYRNHEPVFLTGNASLEFFTDRYGKAITSRLHAMGGIIEMNGQDYRSFKDEN